MDFGITLKPDLEPRRLIALTRQAEVAGFGYGWIFDSHVLWKEPYPLLTLMALHTERMRLGTCVTNPATRDPSVTASALATLNVISGGRMDLGIGPGDRLRWRADSTRLGTRATAGLDRGVWPAGAAPDRSAGRWRHPAIRRPGPDPLVPRFRARGCRGGRARSGRH